MSYDFDRIIDRRNTNSVKYDFAAAFGKPESALPLWVADMDFAAPPEVAAALERIVRHNIYGYSDANAAYEQTLATWYAERFGWKTDPSWLVRTPGIVFAICTAIRALTHPGDAVLVQRPVYHPFSRSIEDNERTLVNNALVYRDGAYEIDFDGFERALAEQRVKLFLLCSPHNPVGRVWREDELRRMGDLCIHYGVRVVADEIHADFVYEGFRHHIFADLDPAYREITVTCTAPSKTFNLAGLQASNIWIPNAALRQSFRRELQKTGYAELSITALAACQAAYAHGGPWLEALKQYLAANLDYLQKFLISEIPEIRLVRPEGTYLAWLDCTALGLDAATLDKFMLHRAGLWLDDGARFGPEGEGFQRVNIACPRRTLETALRQLASSVRSLRTK